MATTWNWNVADVGTSENGELMEIKTSSVSSCMNWWPAQTFANLFISFCVEKTKAHTQKWKTASTKWTEIRETDWINENTKRKKPWNIGREKLDACDIAYREYAANEPRKTQIDLNFFRFTECVKDSFIFFLIAASTRTFNIWMRIGLHFLLFYCNIRAPWLASISLCSLLEMPSDYRHRVAVRWCNNAYPHIYDTCCNLIPRGKKWRWFGKNKH